MYSKKDSEELVNWHFKHCNINRGAAVTTTLSMLELLPQEIKYFWGCKFLIFSKSN